MRGSGDSIRRTGSAWLAPVLRSLVGGILMFSGLSKMPAHTQFISLVDSYHILPGPLATAYATVLPWVELVAGAYLILGIFPRISAAIAGLMGISYAVANVTAIVRGEQTCASCFGQALAMPVGYSLAIDILIVGAGLYLMLRGAGVFTLEQWLGSGRLPGGAKRKRKANG